MNKILIVDDDRSIRELLQLHLSNAGYEALVAEDGDRRRPPDPAVGARPDDRRSGYDFHERHRVLRPAEGRRQDARYSGRFSRLERGLRRPRPGARAHPVSYQPFSSAL